MVLGQHLGPLFLYTTQSKREPEEEDNDQGKGFETLQNTNMHVEEV